MTFVRLDHCYTDSLFALHPLDYLLESLGRFSRHLYLADILLWKILIQHIYLVNYISTYIVTWFLIPISNPNLFLIAVVCFHQHYLVGSKIHETFRIPEKKFVKPCAEQFRCTYILSGQELASCVQFWNLALVPKIFKKTRTTIIYLYKFNRQFLDRYLIIKGVNSFLSTLNTLVGTGSEWPKYNG